METTDLTRRLLVESDQYAEMVYWDNNIGNNFDDSYSDISSGYHSTGILSDVSSFSSEESCGSQSITDNHKPEVMRFQSVQPLCDNLKLILSMPELCDVTFLVGPDQTPVHGLRAILGTRSRKFYDLIVKYRNTSQPTTKKCSKNKPSGISNSLSDRLIIPVKKYDAEVFRKLVQFVHSGSVNVTEDTAAGLYCGACQFELPDLSRACLDFIERRVQSGDYHKLLRAARDYTHHGAAQTLIDKKRRNRNKETTEAVVRHRTAFDL